MVKSLIVNADDYGRTSAISAGIRHTHLHGLVTTTTVMMNFGTAVADIHVALAECPKLGLGVHLTLTAGRPVLPPTQIPTLVDGAGAFLKLGQLEETYNRVNPKELRAEWQAQIEKFIATGAKLDHLDSHHHTSYFNELVMGLMLDLAHEYDAPVRRPRARSELVTGPDYSDQLLKERAVRSPICFISSFYDEGATLEHLLAILANLPEGSTELMSHPGYIDDDLLQTSSYNRQREREIAVLTSDAARQTVLQQKLTLATFRSALS
jgi:predicted glycoside hydrolase/deacetylase ChbG (UPF0249 family)